jgi:hypothetical protein
MSADHPTIASLQALVDRLAADNERLRRALARRDRPADTGEVQWVALKAAVPDGISYESVRSWCEAGHVRARKDGGRWYVDAADLRAALARRFAPRSGLRCA